MKTAKANKYPFTKIAIGLSRFKYRGIRLAISFGYRIEAWVNPSWDIRNESFSVLPPLVLCLRIINIFHGAEVIKRKKNKQKENEILPFLHTFSNM